MLKKTLPASTVLYPLPAVLVTCKHLERDNIITLSWVGTVCSAPPTVAISVRPTRYSHHLIVDSGEFVINVPKASQLKEVDYCGMVSGREIDKFKECCFNRMKASKIKTPLIAECPVHLECVVKETLHLGSHDMFIGEVIAIDVSEDCFNESGRLQIEKTEPFFYFPGDLLGGTGEYRAMGVCLGRYGLAKPV